MRGNAVQEPTVMANDHDAAGKFQKRIFQGAQGFDV